MDTNEFIERAKRVHGDKYDYNKVEYINSKTRVCIVCPTHGEFWQKPYNHLNGQGCGKCRYEMLSSKYRKTTRQWIEEAKKVHDNKYDYSKVVYKTCQDKVCIICPTHGEFWQEALSHIQGQGCPYCNGNAKKTTEKFIQDAKKVHGDKYDYSKVVYVNNKTKVCIICHKKDDNGVEHGEFWQTPHKHLIGRGCSRCNESNLETAMSLFLERNGIEFEEQKKFDWLGKMTLDFYLPKHNIAIECQGGQHFIPVEHFGGENGLKEITQRDKKKKQLCEEHGIKLLYFSNSKVKKQVGGEFPYDVIISENKLKGVLKEGR